MDDMTARKLSANNNVTVYNLKLWRGNPKGRSGPQTKFKEPVCMCCGYPETIERLMKNDKQD